MFHQYLTKRFCGLSKKLSLTPLHPPPTKKKKDKEVEQLLLRNKRTAHAFTQK